MAVGTTAPLEFVGVVAALSSSRMHSISLFNSCAPFALRLLLATPAIAIFDRLHTFRANMAARFAYAILVLLLASSMWPPASVQAFAPSGWKEAHATYYGGADAAGTQGAATSI